MKANKEFRTTASTCVNCSKQFHSRYSSKGLYCNNKCQQEYQTAEKYRQFLINPDIYKNRMNLAWIKPIIIKEQGNKCILCGNIAIWEGNPLVLVLDHIDGNAGNNVRENLRCVCPNCDSQLDTFKSKNKNSTRHYYRYRYNGE